MLKKFTCQDSGHQTFTCQNSGHKTFRCQDSGHQTFTCQDSGHQIFPLSSKINVNERDRKLGMLKTYTCQDPYVHKHTCQMHIMATKTFTPRVHIHYQNTVTYNNLFSTKCNAYFLPCVFSCWIYLLPSFYWTEEGLSVLVKCAPRH